MINQNMLVVARKYNDIYYAISTDEWKRCKNHYLLMITDRLDMAKYPMQHLFKKVFTVHTEKGTWGYFKQCMKIKGILSQIDFSVVTVSNLALVSNLCVLSSGKTKEALLLEDGLMNYYQFKPSQRLSKKVLEFVLGVNEESALKRITKTYLLKPELAQYYYGAPTQLQLDVNTFLKHANIDHRIEGKSIFVGQDLYYNSELSVQEYSEIVNKVIQDNNIDLYIPHTRSVKEEYIKCKTFDLMESQTTLEIYAAIFKLKIYSFSSSVLYTTKIINPEVSAYSVRNKKTDRISDDSIIYKYVDKVICVD